MDMQFFSFKLIHNYRHYKSVTLEKEKNPVWTKKNNMGIL